MKARRSPAAVAQDGDFAWFDAHPDRSIRVRRTARDERPDCGEWPLMLVMRTPLDTIERRSMRGDPLNVPDDETFLLRVWFELFDYETANGRGGVLDISAARHAAFLQAGAG
jgi:hypothetical protein